MDIRQEITNIESELVRLEKQKQQEIAMLEVLPVRFAMNMDAFKKFMPSIYVFFESYQPVRPFRFFAMKMAFLMYCGLMSKFRYTGKILL